MPLPGPVHVGRRLFGALVRRPAAALRPYLSESHPAEPTLFDEFMTVTAGAGSFAVVSLGFLCFAFLATCYAVCYPVLRRLADAADAFGTRLGR